MKKISNQLYAIILFVVVVIECLAIAIMSGFNKPFVVISVLILLALGFLGYYLYRTRYLVNVKNMDKVAKTLDASDKYAMTKFPLPIIISDEDGNIVWFNALFAEDVMLGFELTDNNISQFFGAKRANEIPEEERVDTDYGGKNYSVIKNAVYSSKNDLYIYYFIDKTQVKQISKEYELSRPVVMLINVDGIDETSNLRDSEKAGYHGAVENLLETWAAENNGLMRKTDTTRFICIVEERQYKEIVAKRFEILDRVREFKYNETSTATLSIGIGKGKTLVECDDAARQAFDMALGRGGDQAAVKNEDTFEFYGGISRGVEKRTKMRTRVVASKIKKLIEGSDRVITMGHKFSDLDSVGACVAMCSASRALGKEAFIAIRRETSLATPLVTMLDDNGLGDMIITPEQAMEMVTDKTLLIVVDTHIRNLLESDELYEKCSRIVVIDHHRKVVGHIDDAEEFYHEPSSSSTCEMVAEILQYMGPKQLVGKIQAEALLSGIMLDTRNFALRTGVRTFEAAAYLRSNGVDTITVRRLFASTMENYRDKNKIVSSAQVVDDYAVSTVEFEIPNIRVVSSQAADEMLNIEGVKASFVLYAAGPTINISARSLGDVNVQLIMEKMGGGGHQTMAAAQIKTDSMAQAKQMLFAAIGGYVSDLS
ncbi:MAG: DHH family phosphoesterase [Clostridia bacterium]|nr:DHH family phosphoesterase [Clostridia bacterium]